jgi:hypothetical protein
MRKLWVLAFFLACPAAVPAGAQTDGRALENELARDFLALELAGWRLPDPVLDCIEKLRLTRLAPGTYGAAEMAVDPVLVDGAGPHAQVVEIASDPTDRRRRIVRFQWFVREGSAARTLQDRFTMAIDPADRSGTAATMMMEPERLVVRRECFGG